MISGTDCWIPWLHFFIKTGSIVLTERVNNLLKTTGTAGRQNTSCQDSSWCVKNIKDRLLFSFVIFIIV